MAKRAVVAISVLLASQLLLGQVPAPNTAAQAGPSIGTGPSQTDNGMGLIPTFYSHPHQVLVTVTVWRHATRSAAWVPKEILKRHPTASDMLATPPEARGLSVNEFRIFDNGTEQKINYLEETDFPWQDINQQWFFAADVRGSWGWFNSVDLAIAVPKATYIIGYIPPPFQSGDCHTIRVVAGDNDVVLNRNRYCNTEKEDMATRKGKKLVERMETLAKSDKRGSIKVSSQLFVFWSSRVLSLIRDSPKPTTGSASASAAANYRYVVVVDDSRAPATVQIATGYELEARNWDALCSKDHPAIHVLGVVYKTDREVAARFGDSYACPFEGHTQSHSAGPAGANDSTETWFNIPSHFNTQVELRPGDYDVHVVVSDGHKFGQTRVPLRVESIDNRSLAISDIALNGIRRDESWLLRDAAQVSPEPLLPSPLISEHAQFILMPEARLRETNPLPLYFEIYEPLLANQNTDVYFHLRITDLKDGKLVMNAGPTSAAQNVTARSVVIPIALNVDTEKLESGNYSLEIQASDSAGRTTEWRMAKFEIQ